MEAKVIRAFTDRFTNVVYLPDATFVGEGDRIAELAKGGYVDEPSQPAEKPKKKAAAKKTK